jgi:hypothetical protein
VSRLRADTLTDRTGTSAPDLTHGATSTTGTFSGDLGGGNVNLSGNATVDGTLTYQDADNINSTGIITAQQGIQVSANGFDVTGISTFNSPITVAGITTINESGLHATGVVTATSFAGDGSALTGTNRTISGIASGTLANGQTVIIHSDGKVGFITETALSTPTVSDPVVFESAYTQWTSAVYDSNSNKVVIAYRDKGNSDYGTAVVGTVSGTSITFGKPVIFEYDGVQHVYATYDSNSNKVVIAYRDNGNSEYGTAIVGTVSGTSISFGSATVFESAETDYISATFDSSNNKVVIAYRDVGNSNYGTAVVGTVSGTSISFGTPVVFESVRSDNISATFDSSNNKVVIAYKDTGNASYGTAIVGTVSGTSISFGTAVVFNSETTSYFSATFDSANNKVVIAYRDSGNSGAGTAVVGTVSGTSISFGSAVVYETGNTIRNSSTFDSARNKVIITYYDNENSNDYGTFVVGTVSGTSISFGTPVVFDSSSTNYPSATYDSTNNKVVISYLDGGNSNYGTAVVVNNTGTTLTTENFIGFSDAAYTNGQTATVQIITALDDAQSGLTTGSKHYVQTDGTLSTTAGSPSVLAGTAISDTEIIVKQ